MHEKKKMILEVMLRLISEQGIHATPMSQIAKEAGVAAGTIYHYFPSKEALLNDLYLEVKRDLGLVLSGGLAAELPVKDKFWKMWKELFTYYTQNKLMFHFSSQMGHSPMISAGVRAEGKLFYQPIINFFEQGVASGAFRRMDANLMAELVYSSVAATVSLSLLNDVDITEELVQQAIQFSWDGIAAQHNA